jgi:shikimate dehydrogenase
VSRNTDFISKNTKLFVSLAELPGNTGTVWFNQRFTEFKIDALYKAFQVQRGEFKKAWGGVRALKISGGAISMPFKREAAELVDSLEGVAERVGTINTFMFAESGKLIGYNTDYLASFHYLPSSASSVYLLGAGGVAASLALAVSDKKLSALTVISRKRENHLIPTEVNYEWVPWEQLSNLSAPEVLINATSLGMTPDSELKIPESWWRGIKTVIDLTFRPEGTALAKVAKLKEITLVDGQQFARFQAIEQFKIYTGLQLNYESYLKII